MGNVFGRRRQIEEVGLFMVRSVVLVRERVMEYLSKLVFNVPSRCSNLCSFELSKSVNGIYCVNNIHDIMSYSGVRGQSGGGLH